MPIPVAELDEHAAVSGVAIVTGQLGSTVGTGAVVAEWVTGKVQLVQLTAARRWLHREDHCVPQRLREPGAGACSTRDGALFVGDWTSGKLYRITA